MSNVVGGVGETASKDKGSTIHLLSLQSHLADSPRTSVIRLCGTFSSVISLTACRRMAWEGEDSE